MADNKAVKEAKSQVIQGLASDQGKTIKQLTSSGRSAKEYRSASARAECAKAYAKTPEAEENKEGDGEGKGGGDGESEGS